MNYAEEIDQADNSQHDVPDRDQSAKIRNFGLNELRPGSLDLSYASSADELKKSFSLVYESYLKRGLVPTAKSHKMLFSIYSLLPGTVHAVAKHKENAVSNLTGIPNTEEFGLPMDALYKSELDRLRDLGRNIVELSSLATMCEYRGKNLFLYQIQAMYWYFIYKGVDDICIMVHPRHKKYYKKLFPFEDMGPVRHYPKVNAPAVGLRGNLYRSLESMMALSKKFPFNIPLYRYINNLINNTYKRYRQYRNNGNFQLMLLHNNLSGNAIKYFMRLEPGIARGLNHAQLKCLGRVNPDLMLAKAC